MDAFIQQLTHDDQQFEAQWPNIFDKLHKLYREYEEKNVDLLKMKIKILDAFVDYILAEVPNNSKTRYTKESFVELIPKLLGEDPLPPLSELVRIFRRILDARNIFDKWHLKCVEAFCRKFKLFGRLASSKSTDLITLIFQSLQRHTFFNKQVDKDTQSAWQDFLSRYMFSRLSMDTDSLNREETMLAIRSSYQHLFRYSARMSSESQVWASVSSTLAQALSTLFDEYANLDDAKSDLVESVKQPISADFISLLVKSYEKNVQLFKSNALEVINATEQLLLINEIDKARQMVNRIILVHIDSTTDIIDPFARMLLRICAVIHVDYRDALVKEVISNSAYKLSNLKCNKKLAPLFFELVLAILGLCVIEAPKSALNLLGKADFYPWKDLAPKFKDLVRLCVAYDKIYVLTYFSDLDSIEDILQLVVERAKVNNAIFRATHSEALQATFRWAKPPIENNKNKIWCRHVYRTGQRMIELIDHKQVTNDIYLQLIKLLTQRVIDNDDDDDVDDPTEINRLVGPFFIAMATHLRKYLEILQTPAHEVHRELASFFLLALKRPLKDEKGQATFENVCAMILWFSVGQHVKNEADARLYGPCVQYMHALACDDDEKTFFDWWNVFWSVVSMKLPDVACDYINEFLEDLIERKQLSIAGVLPTLYAKRPNAFLPRLNDIINKMLSGDMSYTSLLGNLFWVITKDHPELITEDQVDQIFADLKEYNGTSNELHLIFQGLGCIANAQSHFFHKHRDTILRFIIGQQNISAFMCLQQYLVASTIVDGQERADESMKFLIDLLQSDGNIGNDIRKQVFHTCQLIGVINKQALESKRAELEKYNSYSECRTLLDIIDGNKMSDENQAVINQTREEITQIQRRVVKTEKDVQNITKTVKRQELNTLQYQYEQQRAYSALAALAANSPDNSNSIDTDIERIDRIELFIDNIFLQLQNVTNLSARVDTVDVRLDDVAEQLKVHAQEIERIDAKTLSYVPAEWGREVSKLLNRRADNDWRLLGKRFGYSTSELRHWALQADPSMALLNEWFMTHKADEATYGLVKTLDDIGRQDVTKVVRDAVVATGQLIPDDMPIEIKRLPPVFLSYQWGTQKAVTTLKTHLEEAGYACWMDIGQMGGGDKLFAKIDAGIRGAKVVICCMNSAYSQSDNCLREVHLTISTGKPLIPLQMEKQKWPPEGALGPIMSEYLYIRFYDRKSNSPDYWPADRFTELLGQIRYHVAPDPDMISQRYSNWFVPRVDNLIFLQPTPGENKSKQQVELKDDTPLVVTHPQVMISYQWDRQTDIVALYKRLTQLGYRCWLDIFQMGGGDSLFEKIDSGIRNAKCVLACVTPNYTKSINCRREMSLADALTKTIVPLLLEETGTWPPSGPMALVFTEKQYVDFRRLTDNNQNGIDVWSSREFDKVLARLKVAVPEVQTEKPRKHLLDMKRPTTASGNMEQKKRSARIKSAPSVPQSRACSLM